MDAHITGKPRFTQLASGDLTRRPVKKTTELDPDFFVATRLGLLLEMAELLALLTLL